MQNDRPNRIPWPPMIYASAAVAGLLLQRLYPLPWADADVATLLQVLGAVLALGALALDATTFVTFRKHKTTIMPHKGATHLITTGPFAWSRNPIYLGNTALVLAAGLFLGNLWIVLAALTAAFATQKLAIEREERHLVAKFGAQWDNYAARVRRWI